MLKILTAVEIALRVKVYFKISLPAPHPQPLRIFISTHIREEISFELALKLQSLFSIWRKAAAPAPAQAPALLSNTTANNK